MKTKKFGIFAVISFSFALSFCFSGTAFAIGTELEVTSVDKNFVNVTLDRKKDETTNIYSESRNGGALDWITFVIKLNPKDADTIENIYRKADDKRSVFSSETDVVGTVYVPSKSWFRYLDLSALLSSALTNVVLGDVAKEKVTIPSSDGHVYLVRSYSGALGLKDDVGEVFFVASNDASFKRNVNAFSLNALSMAFDSISAVSPVGLVSGGSDILKGIIKDVMISSLTDSTVKSFTSDTKNPDKMNMLLRTTTNMGQSILKKSVQVIVENVKDEEERSVVRNFGSFCGNFTSKALGLVDPLRKISKGGQVVDRGYDLLYNATPLETAYVINAPLVQEEETEEKPIKKEEVVKTDEKPVTQEKPTAVKTETTQKITTPTTSKTNNFAPKYLTVEFVNQYGTIYSSWIHIRNIPSLFDALGEKVAGDFNIDYKTHYTFEKEIPSGTYTVKWPALKVMNRKEVQLKNYKTKLNSILRIYSEGSDNIEVPKNGNWAVSVPVPQVGMLYCFDRGPGAAVKFKIANELDTVIRCDSRNTFVFDQHGDSAGIGSASDFNDPDMCLVDFGDKFSGFIYGVNDRSSACDSDNVPPGKYTIKINKDGYQPKEVNFVLPDVSSWSDERIWSEKPGVIDLGTIILKKL